MMKTKPWAVLSLCALLTMFAVSLAQAADGTLKFAFKYKDPATGVETNLSSGYVYLRDATKSPPMEKFLSKADYILRPSGLRDGSSTVAVPAGKYYLRILQRKVIGGTARPYGPPEAGDLTWFQTTPVTITAGGTLDLGTKYANPYGSTITITGTIRNSSGAPLAGRYVRAHTEPCLQGGIDYGPNQCGPVKFLALQPTDANGRYTIVLRDPGTYYVSTFSSWDTSPGCSGYCAAPIIGTGYPQPVSVQMGENRAVDIVSYY